MLLVRHSHGWVIRKRRDPAEDIMTHPHGVWEQQRSVFLITPFATIWSNSTRPSLTPLSCLRLHTRCLTLNTHALLNKVLFDNLWFWKKVQKFHFVTGCMFGLCDAIDLTKDKDWRNSQLHSWHFEHFELVNHSMNDICTSFPMQDRGCNPSNRISKWVVLILLITDCLSGWH